MDTPEKLATLVTQNTGQRQTKQKTIYKKTNTNNINKTRASYKQLEV